MHNFPQLSCHYLNTSEKQFFEWWVTVLLQYTRWLLLNQICQYKNPFSGIFLWEIAKVIRNRVGWVGVWRATVCHNKCLDALSWWVSDPVNCATQHHEDNKRPCCNDSPQCGIQRLRSHHLDFTADGSWWTWSMENKVHDGQVHGGHGSWWTMVNGGQGSWWTWSWWTRFMEMMCGHSSQNWKNCYLYKMERP